MHKTHAHRKQEIQMCCMFSANPRKKSPRETKDLRVEFEEPKAGESVFLAIFLDPLGDSPKNATGILPSIQDGSIRHVWILSRWVELCQTFRGSQVEAKEAKSCRHVNAELVSYSWLWLWLWLIRYWIPSTGPTKMFNLVTSTHLSFEPPYPGIFGTTGPVFQERTELSSLRMRMEL